MAAVDNAIDNISEARATAGALISRFEFRGQQIATSLENIDAAKSAIMAVVLAAEQSKLVSSQALLLAAVQAVSPAKHIPPSPLRVPSYAQIFAKGLGTPNSDHARCRNRVG